MSRPEQGEKTDINFHLYISMCSVYVAQLSFHEDWKQKETATRAIYIKIVFL